MGLTHEQAQSVFNLQVVNAKDAVRAQQAAWDKNLADWKALTIADKDIDIDLANKGLAAIARPELNEFLTSMGIGNHPEIVRAFAWVGKAIGDDNINLGRGGADDSIDAAKVLYPDQK